MDMWATEDDNGQRARSFRHEDYNNRRVFLRSYPLPWEDQEDDDVVVTTTRVETLRIPNYANLLKRKFVFVLGWSKRKALLLRKLKSKLGLNLVPCHPLGLNPTSATSLL